MTFRAWIIVIVAVATLGTLACGGDTEVMPTATAVSPAIAAAVASAPAGAAEFVAFLERLGEARDWATIQALATEDFSAYPSEVFVRTVRGQAMGSPYFTSADQWQLEADTAVPLVTLRQPPEKTYTLQKTEDGSWRWNPGPWIHTWAEVFEHGRNGPGLLDQAFDIHIGSELIPEIIHSMTISRVDIDGLFPEVTFEQSWAVNNDDLVPAARLAFGDFTWETDSTTGSMEVTWANTRVTSDAIEFPELNRQGLRYFRFSVRLIDFPAGTSVATVNLNEIFDNGGNLRIRLSIPMRNYPVFDSVTQSSTRRQDGCCTIVDEIQIDVND